MNNRTLAVLRRLEEIDPEGEKEGLGDVEAVKGEVGVVDKDDEDLSETTPKTERDARGELERDAKPEDEADTFCEREEERDASTSVLVVEDEKLMDATGLEF